MADTGNQKLSEQGQSEEPTPFLSRSNTDASNRFSSRANTGGTHITNDAVTTPNPGSGATTRDQSFKGKLPPIAQMKQEDEQSNKNRNSKGSLFKGSGINVEFDPPQNPTTLSLLQRMEKQRKKTWLSRNLGPMTKGGIRSSTITLFSGTVGAGVLTLPKVCPKIDFFGDFLNFGNRIFGLFYCFLFGYSISFPYKMHKKALERRFFTILADSTSN